MSRLYDVAVIGAGPGGSAAAHYLAKSGLDVLLLDKSEFPRDKTCGDGLTPRALHVLQDMGILNETEKQGFRINALELHARSGSYLQSPIPDHPDYPDHLLILPRFKLDEIIRRRAIKSGAHFESPVWIRGAEVEDDAIRLITDSSKTGKTYRACVAILALGASQRLLKTLGILKHRPKMIMGARAYFENISDLSDRVQAHFSAVPLPGYAWVFPISATAANVGLGYWQTSSPFSKKPASARTELQNFLQSAKIRRMLKGAKSTAPIQSYPLRIDFNSAPTFGERVLLVGESAGLVSPLTGEGIDFALESGKLAASFLSRLFQDADFSQAKLAAYDDLLRQNYQSMFRFFDFARRLYLNPLLMDRAIRVARKRPEIKRLLVNVLMSQQHPSDLLSPQLIRRVLFDA